MNGQMIKMTDLAFGLFMELLVELKKGKGGWLTKVVDELNTRYLTESGRRLKVVFWGKDGLKFIEGNGLKQSRISAHPDFVTFDRTIF